MIFTHCSNDEDFENNNQENINNLTKSEEITQEDVQLKLAETLINFNNVVKQFYDGSNSDEYILKNFRGGSEVVSLLMFMVNNPDSDLTEFFGLHESDFTAKGPCWDKFKQTCENIKNGLVSAYNWLVDHWKPVLGILITIRAIIGYFQDQKSISMFTIEINTLIPNLPLNNQTNSSLGIKTMRT